MHKENAMRKLSVILIVIISIQILETYSLRCQVSGWQRTKGPYGVQVYDFEVDNSGNLLAATDIYGIYRTTNNGLSWVNLHPDSWLKLYPMGYPTSFVYRIAVSGSGAIFGASAHGLLVSRDNGSTWDTIYPDGSASSVVEVCADDAGLVLYSVNGKLFRSIDDGNTWTSQTVTYGSGIKTTLNSITIRKDGILYAGHNKGVLKSTDAGLSWSDCGSGWSSGSYYSISTNSLGYIFVVNVPDGGIFRSTDNGNSWNPIISGLPYAKFGALAVDQNDCLYINLGDLGLFQSTNHGNTWKEIRVPQEARYITSLYAVHNGYLFCGISGCGAYRLFLDGNTWEEANVGMGYPMVNMLSVNSRGDLFAATEWNGLYRTTDSGERWEKMIPALANTRVFEVVSNARGATIAGFAFVFVPFQQDYGLYRTTDNGNNWMKPTVPFLTGNVEALAVDKKDVFYASPYSKGIYQSVDNGATWTPIPVNSELQSVNILAVSARGDLFASSTRTYRTSDQGKNWIEIDRLGFGLDFISCIFIDNNDSVYITGRGGIYRSGNYGDSWTCLNNGLGDSLIACVTIDQYGNMYAGSVMSGVYLSTDAGKNWNAMSDGLENRCIFSLAIDKNGTLFAGTYDGVFKRKIFTKPTSVRSYIPQFVSLSQNFPNPFHDQTSITFSLPHRAHVRLKIFDALGREVTTLVDEEREAGEQVVELDLKRPTLSLPSGVYFYQLEVGGKKLMKKMLKVDFRNLY